ncbi:glycosyltransferase family 2 protein [Hyphomicrobium facile]|uniref:Glycosyl transferase family 2 n=1 Tax=Hyphomicrobium facile TaxID=51670 RepID=A0A1I7MUT5_9HYPH|nr:glycosyltransferase family A protein [Hyphomicrobium facile]SFV26161.1 Glycosyl transferase family 2 [Hyphomicrobium facile]
MTVQALPRISVIMTTYNGAEFVEQSIGSLTAEAGVDLDIVVVDDSSTDGTLARLRDLEAQDPHIRVFAGEKRGIAGSRNAGLAEVRHEFLTFLDQDDLCMPGRLARQAALIQGTPGVAAVMGETLMFQTLGPDRMPLPGTNTARILGIQLSAGLFRTSAVRPLGFDSTFTMADDFDLILRLLETDHEIAVEREIATLHRRHAGNTSGNIPALRLELVKVFQESLKRRRAAGRVGPIMHPLVAAMSRAGN